MAPPMAVPACFHLAETVFPRVRAEAGRQLVAKGWSQTRAGQHLGISQAMVSKYVTSSQSETDPLVLRLVADLVDVNASPSWCQTLDVHHSKPGAGNALEDLLGAEAALLAASPANMMPQLGINIAVALPDAIATDDVLAYPARIVNVAGKFLRPAAPTYGASQHLSQILLAVRGARAQLRCVANVRGGRDVAQAIAATPSAIVIGDGDRTVLVPKAVADGPSLQLGATTVTEASIAHGHAILVHDEGGLGIEPCLYVFGESAAAVVATIQTISKQLLENP